jgi:hypothetical protein
MTDPRIEPESLADAQLLARIWDWADQSVEPIDPGAIARAAISGGPVAERDGWLRMVWWLAGAGTRAAARTMGIVAAATIVALFAGVLLTEALTTRRTDEPLSAIAPAASPAVSPSGSSLTVHRYQSAGFHPRGPLRAGVLGYEGDDRYQVIRDSRPSSFAVRSPGWVSDGVSTITRSTDGASLRFWRDAPGGIYADPCAGGPIRALVGPGIDPVATMASIPDTVLVSGPSEVVVAGRLGMQFLLGVPARAECDAGFRLWSDEDPDSDAEAGDMIAVWIVPWDDTGDFPLWIEGRTPKGAGLAFDPEIESIVASMIAPEQPLFPPASGMWPERPSWSVNEAHGLPSYRVRFDVPPGWDSTGYDDVGNGGGSLLRGETGTPGGAVVTFSSPDQVYADPCAHTLLDPPPGSSIDDLAAALAAMSGTDLVSGPTTVTVPGSSVQGLVLRIREDIGCQPEQFYLWADECAIAYGGADEHPGDDPSHRLCLERPDPRPARALGSTIRLWVGTKLGGPPGLRFVIDAETYAGAPSEVEREVQQVLDSVSVLGGWSG